MSQVSVEQEILQDYTHQGRKKIPSLTGIRGIAAVWIVILHYFHFPTVFPQSKHLDHLPVIFNGYMGVDLFFMLSGYVLYMTYSDRLHDPSPASVKRFYISRIFRVFPLHWAMLSVFLVVFLASNGNWLSAEQGPYTVKTFLLALFLVQSWVVLPLVWNAPAWSLSDEWLAYLAFPLLVMGIRRVPTWWLALAIVLGDFVIFSVICQASHDPGLDHVKRIGLIRCLSEFPAGMLLCRMTQLRKFPHPAPAVFFVVGLLLLGVAMISVRIDFLALPASALLIVSCATGSRWADVAFGNRVCHWLGEISYSIYLVHFLLLETTMRIAEIYYPTSVFARLGLMGIGLAAVLPLAHLTWRYIEVPGQALGRIVAGAKGKPAEGARSIPAG